MIVANRYNLVMRIPFTGTYRTLNRVMISSDSLIHNIELYKKLLPNQAICPVLKSNAYGHGLLEVAQVLDPLNLAFLVVDSLYEAYELQKAGIRSDILILGYTFPENLVRKKLPFHFAVSDWETLEILARQGAKIHLKLDTGMNRMGFTLDELPEVLKKMKLLDVELVGLLTHFADADNALDDQYTVMQMKQFQEAIALVHRAGFSPKWFHGGGASGAAIIPDGKTLNMVRLGLGMYGISPFDHVDSRYPYLKDLKPVMEVRSTLVGLRPLKAGDRVSYNGVFEADRDMVVGIMPFGYYEGLPRVLSGKGFVEVKGIACPVVGRICMNYSMVDVSKVLDVEVGDEVVVISSQFEKMNTFQKLAQLEETIPYELMVRMAQSIRREVV
jgi:alanine racemase